MKNEIKTYKIDDVKHYPDYHKELWNWLAENPDKSKDNWFDKFWKDSVEPEMFCFGCEATNILVIERNYNQSQLQPTICCLCGFYDSSQNTLIGECCFGLWDRYMKVKPAFNDGELRDRETISKIAKKIADLDCNWMVENGQD